MSERCKTCDRVECKYQGARAAAMVVWEATDATHENDYIPSRLRTEADNAICTAFFIAMGECHKHRVDWRERAKKAEAFLDRLVRANYVEAEHLQIEVELYLKEIK